MIELNKLYNCDCMELMAQIPDRSIDTVICDLPYGVTELRWDKIIDCKLLFAHYRRICKQKANVLLFCQISLANLLINSALQSEFSHCLIWCKQNKTRFLSAKSLPLSQYEMILCFRLNKYANEQNHYKLREYFTEELKKSGKSIKEIEAKIPNRSAHHWFRFSSDYRIPTEKNYLRLQEITGCFCRPYSELKKEFAENNKRSAVTYNGINESDLLHFTLDEKRIHPTQKPVSLLEYLIKIYSNKGDTILDNCIGSGTTAVACINTGRNFVGCEIDEEYYRLANERLKAAQAQLTLF